MTQQSRQIFSILQFSCVYKVSTKGIFQLLGMPSLSILNLTSCNKIRSNKLLSLDLTVCSRRKEQLRKILEDLNLFKTRDKVDQLIIDYVTPSIRAYF